MFSSRGRYQNLWFLCVAGLGCLLSGFLYSKAEQYERAQLQAKFERLAGAYADTLQETMDSHLQVLDSLAGLYAASQRVDRDEFQTFTSRIFKRCPEIHSLSWLIRVPEAERAAFEESVRQEGFPDFRIWQSRESSDGEEAVAASGREEYFPLYFIEPLERDKQKLGLDLSSLSDQWETMRKARDLGSMTATAPIRVSVKNEKQEIIRIFLPIYRNGAPAEGGENRRTNLQGFVSAAILIPQMARFFANRGSEDGIAVSLQETVESPGSALQYEIRPILNPDTPKPPGHPSKNRSHLRPWRGTIRVADRLWVLTASATPEFFTRQNFHRPWMILLVGFLITLSVCGILYNSMFQAGAVEQLVIERTKNLNDEIKQRRRLEAELRGKAEALETTNAEMNRREPIMQSLLQDLSQSKERLEKQADELQKANQQLHEFAKLKDEFVAKVSHELRTPLTSIKEGLNLMLDGALGGTTETQVDFLKTMNGDIDRLTELINNMLDLSKIEAGRMRLNRRRVGLVELVASTIKSYQAISAGRAVTYKTGTVPDVFVDSNRILQVLGNLFSNAMKYGKPGGKIEFILEPHDGMVAVRVADDGEGIPPDEIPKLFQKFSRLQRLGQEIQGTGLGLVVCKELVELHGGRIEVQSAMGEGTVFSVLLPPYSDALALNESFLELARHESAGRGEPIGLIVTRVPSKWAQDGRKRPEDLAEEIQRRLHRGDVVLTFPSGWVAVLAALDLDGVQAVLRRLREQVAQGQDLEFGFALYPQEGHNGEQLFQQAVQMYHRQRVPL